MRAKLPLPEGAAAPWDGTGQGQDGMGPSGVCRSRAGGRHSLCMAEKWLLREDAATSLRRGRAVALGLTRRARWQERGPWVLLPPAHLSRSGRCFHSESPVEPPKPTVFVPLERYRGRGQVTHES